MDGDRDMSDVSELKFNVKLSGFNDTESAQAVGNAFSQLIKAISGYMNLSSLVGVSIGYDYQVELNSVDRGTETTTTLTPSDGDVIGVAMAVRVVRDGKPKSHLVFNAAYIEGLVAPIESESWMSSVAIIAHECAHVSNNSALNKCFPGLIMSYRFYDAYEQLRSSCWLSVMEEYCATRLSSGVGINNIETYKSSFLFQATKLHDLTKNNILNYRSHGCVDQILREVYGEIETILKLAAYYLGDCAAKGIKYNESGVMEDNSIKWLLPHIDKLDVACNKIFENYGQWKSINEMEVISDILDEISVDLGVIVSRRASGAWVDIP